MRDNFKKIIRLVEYVYLFSIIIPNFSILFVEMALSSVKHVFKKYPLASNCITYGSMCVGAEFSQQFFKKRIFVSI